MLHWIQSASIRYGQIQHFCMFGCLLQGILLHMSYTCLANFVHPRWLARSLGTYLPYMTQSVYGLMSDLFAVLTSDRQVPNGSFVYDTLAQVMLPTPSSSSTCTLTKFNLKIDHILKLNIQLYWTKIPSFLGIY